MGWIIFFAYLIMGILINVFMKAEEEAPKGSKERKIMHNAWWILVVIMAVGVALGALWILGCVWYYLCGGYFVITGSSFFDYVVGGLLTLLPLGFFIGFVMILCGMDPNR